MKMKEIIVSIFLTIILVFSIKIGSEGKEEVNVLDIGRQIKKINKLPIRSIQDEDGRIIDCIDIYHQPAFDHPLLRNHTIQMKPSSIPKERISGKDKVGSRVSLFGKVSCPQGSVPIPRSTEEELLIMNDLSRSMHSSYNSTTVSNYNSGYHFATMSTQEATYYGVQAKINIRGPKMSNYDQSSAAAIWIKSGPTNELNSIQFGWMVNQKLYGDVNPRIYTHWTADSSRKTGCFNLHCSGFVQVYPQNIFGSKLEVAGTIFCLGTYLFPMIFKDPKSGNWWLTLLNGRRKYYNIGYWPNSIFTHLKSSATSIEFGGRVHGVPKQHAPQMGSGKFILPNHLKTCYIGGIHLILDISSNKLVEPNGIKMVVKSDPCYLATYLGLYKKCGLRYTMLFGGPIHDRCTI